jgi:hypothetical protein
MRILARKHWSWAALPLTLISLASGPAAAADAPNAGSTALPAQGTAAPTNALSPATSDTGSTAPPAAASASVSFVERMPASAFPSTPHVRGLYGGSLWSTFHGLQWPYYPKTGIGVSGYVWIDTGYEELSVNDSGAKAHNITYQLQQGRFVLRVTPTWTSGNYFVQGQAEYVANKDQTQGPSFADADDVWVKAGQWKSFDVQLGRYEGWEIYHFGMGLDLYTLERDGAKDIGGAFSPPAIYGVTNAFYRPRGVGAGAVHLYPTEWLRFELGSQFGNDTGQNAVAGRPVAILDFGWLRLKGGAEYQHLQPQGDNTKGYTNQYGAGGSIQFVFDPYVEFGFNYGFGKQDKTADDGNKSDTGTNSTYSFGGFANARIVDGLLAGVGADYTYLVDQHQANGHGRYQDFDHTQGFVALQYHLFKQLFIKAVGGYALANFNPTEGTIPFYNKMLSGRLRVQYLF